MKFWQNLPIKDKKQILSIVAHNKGIAPVAVEKDWWVTIVLKALSRTSCAEALKFKGGTSLSKGWSLINRFSEDIDLLIKREGQLSITTANHSQLQRLRTKSRTFIHNVLSSELQTQLIDMGIEGFTIENVTTVTSSSGEVVKIDGDKDPTVILVHYNSVLDAGETNAYIPPAVKIEISCLSLDEPTETRRIQSMISEEINDVDDDTFIDFSTVVPTRTFLEKAFLLNEEFQKQHPRTRRMSRHLYDLERMMDTEFGHQALKDMELYRKIVEHRRVFYKLKKVDYDSDYPNRINFCPSKDLLDDWRKDYENMQSSFIYGSSLPFDKLMKRMEELRDRFRQISATFTP